MDQFKSFNTPMGSHMILKRVTEAEAIVEEEYMRYVPYCNAVGSLMYGMIGTRPDLAYPVGLVSRFMSNPLKSHWEAVKWVM